MTQQTAIGEPNLISMVFFFAFIAITLGITYWAARRTRTTEHFYAAGRTVSPGQNGFALAGDYMSAASFLGIAGLVSTTGFDGLIYSTGWLVGWPVVLFLIAEPLRNLGKYTFADVVALRLKQVPVRIAAAIGTLATVIFYLIAQMVGAGGLIKLMFGLSYETAIVIVGAAMIAYVLFGGMIATTWVQIVKAVLLLGGAFLLAMLVLARDRKSTRLNSSHGYISYAVFCLKLRVPTNSTLFPYTTLFRSGAGGLIKLMFGLSYETAIVIVGAAMIAYVLFGGMIATTWVQIVKAVLLLGGAFLLAMLVLA